MSYICDIFSGMTLAECIADMGLTIAQFAERAQVHPATIHRLKNGELPQGGTIQRIVAASEGRLTPADLVTAAPSAAADSEQHAVAKPKKTKPRKRAA